MTKGAVAQRRYKARLRGDDVPPKSWPRGPVPDEETLRRRRKNDSLWRHHRMRIEDWEAMYAAQGGCCYLCGESLVSQKNSGHIDHDHTCCPPQTSCASCRRGLACISCNMIIGMVREDPAKLRLIADALASALARRR